MEVFLFLKILMTDQFLIPQLYTATYAEHTGLLGRLLLEVLQLLMWWRSQQQLELAKEPSCAALSIPSPSSLVLWHLLCLTDGTLP